MRLNRPQDIQGHKGSCVSGQRVCAVRERPSELSIVEGMFWLHMENDWGTAWRQEPVGRLFCDRLHMHSEGKE